MKNLILTRRVKQGVLIYKDGEFVCEVTVTNLGLKQCKLGFVADENIKIDRKDMAKKKSKVLDIRIKKTKLSIVKKKGFGNFFLISQGFFIER